MPLTTRQHAPRFLVSRTRSDLHAAAQCRRQLPWCTPLRRRRRSESVVEDAPVLHGERRRTAMKGHCEAIEEAHLAKNERERRFPPGHKADVASPRHEVLTYP